MRQIRVISFDADGTLLVPGFVEAIWHEAIPALYSQKNGVELAQAREIMSREYDLVGPQRLDWYDVNYWLKRFDLGPADGLIQGCQDRIAYYPEVQDVLTSLSSEYALVVASAGPTEMLVPAVAPIRHYFSHIFSSISDYGQLKSADFYRGMCQTMKVEPASVVHVGDSWQFDFLTPKQIGINAVYLDRGGNDNDGSIANLRGIFSFLA
jgi:putative hydrolase of the HAD superfamily